jgi:hypothetical protein
MRCRYATRADSCGTTSPFEHPSLASRLAAEDGVAAVSTARISSETRGIGSGDSGEARDGAFQMRAGNRHDKVLSSQASPRIDSVFRRVYPLRLSSASSHRAMAAITRVCSASDNSCPRSIPCHFSRQPRQQVAVACCATNTGCPRHGVCLPSFCGAAGASRCSMNARACSSTISRPFCARYSRSFGPSLKLRRKRDLFNATVSSSRSRTMS